MFPLGIRYCSGTGREKEFEKFRVLQDRTYQSDFDRLVAETSDDLTE